MITEHADEVNQLGANSEFGFYFLSPSHLSIFIKLVGGDEVHRKMDLDIVLGCFLKKLGHNLGAFGIIQGVTDLKS